MWRELAGEKFLEDTGACRSGNADQRILEGEPNATAGSRIVSVGKAARRQGAQHIGIVWLPAPIVAFADDRIGYSVKETRFAGARSFVKISRILLQKRGQDRAANECSRNKVRVCCTEALAVTLGAPPIATVSIVGLLETCKGSGEAECDRVNQRLPSQLKFLPRIQRSRRRNVSDIEIGNDAENALFLLYMDLLFRDFHLALVNLDLNRGGDHQLNRRGQMILSWQ